jgi:hypothetical protein
MSHHVQVLAICARAHQHVQTLDRAVGVVFRVAEGGCRQQKVTDTQEPHFIIIKGALNLVLVLLELFSPLFKSLYFSTISDVFLTGNLEVSLFIFDLRDAGVAQRYHVVFAGLLLYQH